MENEEVRTTLSRLFIAADEKEWKTIEELLDRKTYFDYSSFTSEAPSFKTPAEVIQSFKRIIPGFDMSHHQIGNFIINASPVNASAICYLTARYFLKNDSGQNIWTVIGSYEFELRKENDYWKITKLIFNLKFTDGNEALLRMAIERALYK